MDNQEKNNQKPHVSVFGIDVSGGNGDGEYKTEQKEEQKEEQKTEQKTEQKKEDANYYGSRRQWREFRREERWKQRCACGHCHHGSGVFGLALLVFGVLLLLNTISIVPWNVWQFIWPFWPALLVLAGLRIIFGRNWGADGLIFLIGLALFAFIIMYALVHINSPFASHFPSKALEIINNAHINYKFN